jgi:serine protease AprX
VGEQRAAGARYNHKRQHLKSLRFSFCCLLLTLGFLLFSTPARLSAAGVPIDPRVFQDTANGQVGNFLVLLKSQVRGQAVAANLSDRERRGRAVFDALRQNSQATQGAVRGQLDLLGAKYRTYSVANVIAVVGTRAVVDAMAARGDVAKIESDRAFRVDLEQVQRAVLAPTAIEWNIAKVNAPQVWAKGFTGQGRVYANADTGVQWDHPALQPHYRGWNGVSADHNHNWWDAVHYDINGGGNPCGFSSPVPCDDFGHGTHTMGIGIGDDGAGNQIGMAPGAKWIACRNMDQGVGRPSTYIECMEFFLAPWDLTGNNPDPNKRPDAVGNSYTCPPSELCTTDSLQIAMENLRAAGVFMAVSAGNSGSGCSTINQPPSFYASGIAVGATDQNDSIAGFSSRGPITVDSSNHIKPDLAAPGAVSGYPYGIRSSFPPNTYALEEGTSMSSPHVAGAVVLLWSRFPQIVRDVDTTESILEQNAVQLYASSPFCGTDTGSSIPNNAYGYGRLDVLAAYSYADSVYFPFKYIFPLVFR